MKRITITLEPATYHAIFKIAKANKRGVSPEIALVVETYVKSKSKKAELV